jgi:hypothetical protein
MLINAQAKFLTVFDYEEFFRYFPRHPHELGRNCIYWQHKEDTNHKFFYFLDDVFGHVTCPARLNLHAVVLQALQTEAIQLTSGLDQPISRRVDDSLLIHPSTATPIQREQAIQAFTQVCEHAGQPLQQSKVQHQVTKAEFDGYELDLNRFEHNPHNAYGAGVGITDGRRDIIIQRTSKAFKHPGLNKTKTDSLIALIQWVFRVLPMLRPCIIEWRACMHATMRDKDTVTLTPQARQDIQRILEVLGAGPVSTPLHQLFSITPPDGTLTTDASGYDHIGGFYTSTLRPQHKFYFTQQLTRQQVINNRPGDPSPRTDLPNPRSVTYKISTAFLELLGLYYGLITAGKRLNHKVIVWQTDAKAAKDIWTNMKSKAPAIRRLLVLIGTHCSSHKILVDAQWVPREENTAADALTHDDTNLFLQLQPGFTNNDRVSVPVRYCRRVQALSLILTAPS